MSIAKRLAWVFAVLGVLCQVSNARAESPYRAAVFLPDSFEVQELSRADGVSTRSVAPSRRRIRPIGLRANVQGVGWIAARFDRHVPRRWSAQIDGAPDRSDLLLLEGSIRVGHASGFSGERSQPASASLINGRLRVTFRGPSRNGRSRHYTVTGRPAGRRMLAKVASVPESAFARATCGSNHRHVAASGSSSSEHVAATGGDVAINAVKEIDVATDFDPLWHAAFGSSANSEISARIVAASVIYERDLGLVMNIIEQNGYTSGSPYSSTNSGTLLEQFTENPDRRSLRTVSDVQVLFTGIDMAEGVVGIAWTGVMCQFSGQYSYAVVQRLSAQLDHLVLAHELGHSLGAPHVASGIMTAVLNGSATGFSSSSVSTIQGYVASSGSCLATGSGSPAPDPTAGPDPDPTAPSAEQPAILIERAGRVKIIARRNAQGRTTYQQRVTVRGSVYDSSIQERRGYSGVSVSLNVGAQVKATLTSGSDGSFSSRLTLPYSRSSVVRASGVVLGQSVQSNRLTISRVR